MPLGDGRLGWTVVTRGHWVEPDWVFVGRFRKAPDAWSAASRAAVAFLIKYGIAEKVTAVSVLHGE